MQQLCPVIPHPAKSFDIRLPYFFGYAGGGGDDFDDGIFIVYLGYDALQDGKGEEMDIAVALVVVFRFSAFIDRSADGYQFPKGLHVTAKLSLSARWLSRGPISALIFDRADG
jgi:hypothetical protein